MRGTEENSIIGIVKTGTGETMSSKQGSMIVKTASDVYIVSCTMKA